MINSNLMEQILKECTIRRNNAILKCEKLKDELNNNPEFYALERQKRALTLEKGKLLFEKKDTKKIDKTLEQIEHSQEQIIKTLKIKKTDLIPHFACKKCEDTGFINGELCACVKQKYNNQLMKQSNINFDLVPYLDDYSTEIYCDEQKQHMQLVKQNLLEFVNNFTTSKIKNIVLVGSTGVGKTFLAQSVAKQVIKKGHTALLNSAFSINNIFLNSHTALTSNKMQGLNQLIEPELLIVDDLGSEPVLKNVTKEYLLLLINERNMQNKSTIFTTNLMPNNILDKYNERIFSRLFNKANSLCINLQGEDLRLKKN